MPDNPLQGAVQPATTAAESGLTSVGNWANQMANTQIQAQHLQVQKQYLDTYQKEFNYGLGRDMMQNILDIQPMENGPTKKALLEELQDRYTKAGRPISESLLASANDPSFSGLYKRLSEMWPKALGMTGDRAEGFKNMIAEIGKMPNLKMRNDMMNKFSGQVESLLGKEAMAAAMAAKTNVTNDRQYTISAQKGYDSQVKPIQTTLEASERGKSLIEKSREKDGSFKVTPQVLSTIAADQAKIVTQKSNFSEGSEERKSLDNLEIRVGNILQKVTSAPQGVLNKENADQIMTEFDVLGKDAMEQHDRMASGLMGGSTPIQKKANIGRAHAFQSQWAKKLGGWQGGGLQDENGETIENPNLKKGADTAKEAPPPEAKKPDPASVQNAAQSYQFLQQMKDPQQKAQALLLLKKKYAAQPEVLKAVGIQ